MSDSHDMLHESLSRMLAGVVTPARTVAAEADGIDHQAWRELSAFGLVGPDVNALPLSDQMAIATALGRATVLAPLIDSELIARWLADGTGIATAADEILTLAVSNDTSGDEVLKDVRFPNGRHAARALVCFTREGDAMVAVVPVSALKLRHAANLAGEPRDRPGVAALPSDAIVMAVPEDYGPNAVMRRGALFRASAMLGAAARVEELALRYADERVQFGKSLAKFQVIQSYLAELAAECAAASAMLASAIAQEGTPSADLAIAAAKVRAGMMAGKIAAIAHQIHGAMGFTREYPLHLATRRLWAWRDEFGDETWWAEHLGRSAISEGADRYWERVAG